VVRQQDRKAGGAGADIDDARDLLRIGQYCAAMRGAGAYQIVLREDANHIGELTVKDAASLQRAIARGDGSVRWLKNEDCTNNYFLINNQVFLGETKWEDLPQT
jgi:hypothetical protein